jgi:hypothetical protein
MKGAQKGNPDNRFGKIEIADEGMVSFVNRASKTTIQAASQKWTWVPSRKLTKHLPENFFLGFQCITGTEGFRRIYPDLPFAQFIPPAWLGGLAILTREKKLGKKDRQSYRTMWFLFQFSRRMGEFFRNRFARSRDLYVAKAGRSDPKEEDILPDTIGLDARGHGKRWTIGELTCRGEEAARAAGIAKPTSAQRIRYGLLEAARLNPLSFDANKASLLVRSALFQLSPTADKIDTKTLDIVAERLIGALRNHLEDNTQEFRKWLLDPKNSVVHQIAKKRRSRGGRLDEDKVRAALLQLGWAGYLSVGDCISMQMQALRQAVPEPFTAQERVLFNQMHLPQAHFGGLPMILVADRLGLIQDVVWEVWEGMPRAPSVPVLHRLLAYYEEIATKRREADRTRKRPKGPAFDEHFHTPQQEDNAARVVFEHLRERKNITCTCRAPEWQYSKKKGEKTIATLVFECSRCGVRREAKVPITEIKDAARLFLDEP